MCPRFPWAGGLGLGPCRMPGCGQIRREVKGVPMAACNHSRGRLVEGRLLERETAESMVGAHCDLKC